MCGIVGYVGSKEAKNVLLDGLKRLEYRGYDSAGVAIHDGKNIIIKRSEGKLYNLEKLVNAEPPQGQAGIGHTRWATHGRPSETNAHPHRSGNIVIVHNGIIENHAELREFLKTNGHEFSSETDTEVVCHLISYYIDRGKTTLEALNETLKRIKGSYALVIMDEREKDKIFMAKRGNPLVVGLAENENLVASDIPALLPYTKNVVFIEDGETAVITPNTFKLYSDKGEEITRPAQIIPWSPLMAERGGYKHFMLKEIHEQPIAIADTFAGRLRPSKHDIVFDEIKDLLPANDFPYDEITIIACGTSWHAGLIGKYFIESLARIRVNVELASEYRYRNPIINNRTFIIPISQSGETADTLAALNLAKEKKATIVSICNVVGSSITRASNATLYTHAGPEIGVASTKTFTSQLAVLIMFATYLAKHIKKIDEDTACKIVEELVSLPRKMRIVLERADQIKQIADEVLNSPSAIFIGRGVNYPIALEGALKLKEITYMHAEGFPAGELKHGPIALIDYGVPVIALVPQDSTYDKMLSNIEEVRARGANIIAIITNGNPDLTDKASHVISIPKASSYTTPILTSILVQLLAYYVADHKGTDVDQPRNLAKSVTVE